MTTTSIKNLTRTMFVLNLSRDVAPKRSMFIRVVTHRDGSQERKDVRVVHGDSVILLVGETKDGFSNAVRRCKNVINAVRAREIQLIEVPDEVPPAPTASPAVVGSEVVVAVAAPFVEAAVSTQVEGPKNDSRDAAPVEKLSHPKSGGKGKAS